MAELTRVITVEVTMIGDADGAVEKEEHAKAVAARIKEAVGADNVNVTNVQDFVMEDKKDGETGE